MIEISPGIYWLKLPIILEDDPGLSHVNAYLARGRDGYLLVDSGWNTPETFEVISSGLRQIGAGVKDISQIVCTHVHPDHYGMAGRIKQISGATMVMHHMEKAFITPRYVHMEELLLQTDQMLVANGVSHDEMVRLRDATVGLEQFVVPAMPDALLHDGDTVSTGMFTFQVVWTPGHSSGHICLYEPDRKVLISGDHILPRITPNISVHPESIENPLGRYLKSLKETSRLNADLVLPGHDEPFASLVPRIDNITRHHEERNQLILGLIDGEPRSAFQISREMVWGTRARWHDLPVFHQRMAIFETLAHLEMMAANGLLDRLPRNGVNYYRKV
jgi:glyoxylase-like metal-dependent hydrolase (beta-lactamase superfamily II)